VSYVLMCTTEYTGLAYTRGQPDGNFPRNFTLFAANNFGEASFSGVGKFYSRVLCLFCIEDFSALFFHFHLWRYRYSELCANYDTLNGMLILIHQRIEGSTAFSKLVEDRKYVPLTVEFINKCM
jgi:hypothetical protein